MPPRYEEVVAVVKRVVDVWREHAQPGERLADFVDRVGWPRFVEVVGLNAMRDHYVWTPDYAMTFLTYRSRGDLYPRFREAA